MKPREMAVCRECGRPILPRTGYMVDGMCRRSPDPMCRDCYERSFQWCVRQAAHPRPRFRSVRLARV